MRVTFLPRRGIIKYIYLLIRCDFMTKVLITSLGLLETTEGLSIPGGGLYVISIDSD